MRKDGKRLVLETGRCHSCGGSGANGVMETCRTCGGTGKGPRGGRDGCKKCNGLRWGYYGKRETCKACGGAGTGPEDRGDYLPREIWRGLAFRVYREDREQTYNEYLLGVNCVYSCTDYGLAWSASDDAKLIAEVRDRDDSYQACHVVSESLECCDHVGIFVSRGGYSVRAVWSDPREVLEDIARETPKETGMVLGARLAAAGMNGTMLAVRKDTLAVGLAAEKERNG